MLIAKIINNQVGEVADYKDLFPNVSFPSTGPDDLFLAENSCLQVNAFKSFDNTTQKLQVCSPYIEGTWVYTVEVVEKPQEEKDSEEAARASQVRSQRDQLLAECDWVVIKATETGTPIDPEWLAYRQALRDISSQPGFPNEVTYPEKP